MNEMLPTAKNALNIVFYYRLPPLLESKYVAMIQEETRDIKYFVTYYDKDNQSFLQATNFRMLIMRLKSGKISQIILPSRIILWYKGSLTNLVRVVTTIQNVQGKSHPYNFLTDERLAEYLADLKSEDTTITNLRRKANGEAIGRPKQIFDVQEMARQIVEGKSLREVAELHKTCKATVCGRIRAAGKEAIVSDERGYQERLIIKAVEILSGRAKLARKRLKIIKEGD